MNIDKTSLLEDLKKVKQDAQHATHSRAQKMRKYFEFVFNRDQWYEDEIKEYRAKNMDRLTYNFSEDYFEQYLSKLFPRNPQTGDVEIGVSVIDSNNSSEYEQAILESYTENNLVDTLIEQAQNFLIGGVACLYYPQSVSGGANIYSLDPANCYLSWKDKELQALLYYDEDAEQYLYCDKSLIVRTNKDFTLLENLTENKHGFIPFSWIPQMPKSSSREGRSKIASLVDLDRAYNKSISCFLKRAEENSSPHRAIFSDNVDEGKIRRGRDKTTFLGENDDMRHMELKEGKELLDFNEILFNRMKNKVSLVDKQDVSGHASGLSLSFQYSGMLDRIAFMRIYWNKAFKDLNKAILTYKFGKGNYITKPVYSSSLMQDTKQQIEEVIMQVNNGIMSRRDAIDYLQPDVNADKKLQEIEKEKKKYREKDKDVVK